MSFLSRGTGRLPNPRRGPGLGKEARWGWPQQQAKLPESEASAALPLNLKKGPKGASKGQTLRRRQKPEVVRKLPVFCTRL